MNERLRLFLLNSFIWTFILFIGFTAGYAHGLKAVRMDEFNKGFDLGQKKALGKVSRTAEKYLEDHPGIHQFKIEIVEVK